MTLKIPKNSQVITLKSSNFNSITFDLVSAPPSRATLKFLDGDGMWFPVNKKEMIRNERFAKIKEIFDNDESESI